MTVSAAQIRREQEEPQQREDGDTDKGIQEWARTKAVEWMQEVSAGIGDQWNRERTTTNENQERNNRSMERATQVNK